MSKRLDELSRNLASGMSRRRALQIFAGSLLAAAFVRPGVQALAADGDGKAVSDFCKAFCTPFFPGEGNRGLGANYSGFFNNYTSNYTSYGDCMSSCHRCGPDVFNPCRPGTICVQVGQGGFSDNVTSVVETFCIPG